MDYAVILAGGAGTRLWPLSRLKRPKQLIPLIDNKSLLALAVERLKGLFEPANIFVITNAEYADQSAEALSWIPRENIVGEPVGRDTANAIALAAEILAKKDPDATMAVFTADHVIRPVDQFALCVRSALAAAQANPQALLTFGIRPTWPHTGLGYIHRAKDSSGGAFRVQGFKEKPDHQIARRYVESGEYFWNSGMFVWKVGAIRSALDQFLPTSRQQLADAVQSASTADQLAAALEKTYPLLEKISIDFAVMEKAREVLMVELTCEWLDVGSWPALETVSEADESGNIVIAENTALIESGHNIIVSEGDHLLAVLGVDDCIIVHSPDATLVCSKNDAQRLKQLVATIEERFGKKFI